MTPPGRHDSGFKVAAAAVAVLGVVLGIWAGSRVQSNRATVVSDAAQRVPVGAASPPTASDFTNDFNEVPHTALRVPARLPDFTLSDRNGKPTPVATWAGKSLVLNFWATWCAPCRREIPLLKALSTEWAPHGVEVVGVAVDHRDQVAAYASELKIGYPILVGEEDALDLAAKFGVDSPVFPFTVFTDRRGQVVTLYVGELHQAEANLIFLAVQHVNADQVGLAEAQRNIAEGLHALRAAAAADSG
jgi:thiol-disulfide isomerase/thioredoxin